MDTHSKTPCGLAKGLVGGVCWENVGSYVQTFYTLAASYMFVFVLCQLCIDASALLKFLSSASEEMKEKLSPVWFDRLVFITMTVLSSLVI